MDQRPFDQNALRWLLMAALGGGLLQAIQKATKRKVFKTWYFVTTLVAGFLTSWFFGMLLMAVYHDNTWLVLGLTGLSGTMSKSVVDSIAYKYLNIKPENQATK